MRAVVGCLACLIYGWRIYDPKGSYAAFYDASNWLTGQFWADDGAWGVLRNLVNLVLLDQADGFLLGIAFLALLSLPLWGARVCGRWCVRGVKALRRRNRDSAAPPVVEETPLLLRERAREPDEPLVLNHRA